MSAFIPSGVETTDQIIANDGWAPDLSTEAMQEETGLDDTFGAERIAGAVRTAMLDVNFIISEWRAGQSAACLADVTARSYGDTSEKVILYKTAVYARARARLLSVTRDYDSTRDGHNKADALEITTDSWLAQSNEAISRLTGRLRTVVELI